MRDAGLPAGLPGCNVDGESPTAATWSRDGDNSGEEKERRYKAIKKTSLRQQQRNKTV